MVLEMKFVRPSVWNSLLFTMNAQEPCPERIALLYTDSVPASGIIPVEAIIYNAGIPSSYFVLYRISHCASIDIRNLK